MNLHGIRSRAFTLIEMLVVIIIITAILLIAVPSFQSMLNSSEAALADSLLKSGMRAGKDAAIRSTGDQDSAVVFSYSPGGRLTMGVYVKVAEFNDEDGSGNVIRRDVFVPTGINEPVQLPRGWMVRGYSPPSGTSEPSSLNGLLDPSMEWYETTAGRPMDYRDGNWVFPETDLYNHRVWDDGRNRQTFMVRFQAGTGTMKIGAGVPSLIFSPGPNAPWRNSGAFSIYRADQADDAAKFVTRLINAPISGGPTSLTATQRLELLGWESSDTILAKPVSQLALYQEASLAAGLGVRVDRATGCIYQPFVPGTSTTPELVTRTDFANFTRDINRWITGDTNLDGIHRAVSGAGQIEDSPEARIFTIDRYTGALQAVEVQ